MSGYNIFDMLRTKNNQLYIEDISIEEIAKKYSTPCYVYSKSSLIKEFKEYQTAFNMKKDVLVCYSVKASSNLKILNIFKELGAGFDIVSLGELERLKRINADPSKIVFSGVAKSDEEIAESLKYGILFFNVESLDEMENINFIASKQNKIANISIRVNPDIDPKTHPYISTGLKTSKFGIDINQSVNVYEKAANLKNVNPIGIDAHIGSQIFDIGSFVDSLERLIDLYNNLKENNIKITHFDIGGGLGIKYSDDDMPPTKKEFASSILNKFKDIDCSLIIEPGRSLVGNAGFLVTSAQYEKNNYGKHFLIVDAGMNDLLRPSLYNAYHKIEKVNLTTNEKISYEIVGPICETGDVLGTNVQLPRCKKGDLLLIHSAGAYGQVMSSNYNTRPKVSEVLVDNNKHISIRKRETINQMLENEENYE